MNLNDLSDPRTQLVLAVLGILLIGAAFYMLIYSPKVRELDKLNRDVKQQEQLLKLKTVELVSYQKKKSEEAQEKLEEDIKKAKEELAELTKVLPSEKRVPELLNKIDEKAKDSQVDFISLSLKKMEIHKLTMVSEEAEAGKALAEAGAEKPVMEYGELSLDVRTMGDFISVLKFLYELESLPRLIMVDRVIVSVVSVSAEELISPELNLRAEAKTFVLPLSSDGGR